MVEGPMGRTASAARPGLMPRRASPPARLQTLTFDNLDGARGGSGARQSITGLVVNGEPGPRVPRKFRRQLRAAIHSSLNGTPLRGQEPPSILAGRTAYVHMTDPKLVGEMLAAIEP